MHEICNLSFLVNANGRCTFDKISMAYRMRLKTRYVSINGRRLKPLTSFLSYLKINVNFSSITTDPADYYFIFSTFLFFTLYF